MAKTIEIEVEFNPNGDVTGNDLAEIVSSAIRGAIEISKSKLNEVVIDG